MKDDQHSGDDITGNFSTGLSLVSPQLLWHTLPALTQCPADEETKGDQIEDDHLEGCYPYQRGLIQSQWRTDVQVQKEDDYRVDEWGKDGHAGQDVEEDANEAAQPANHHDPGVEGQGVQQVLKVDVDLPAGLTVHCAAGEQIKPVNIYVSSVPGQDLNDNRKLSFDILGLK